MGRKDSGNLMVRLLATLLALAFCGCVQPGPGPVPAQALGPVIDGWVDVSETGIVGPGLCVVADACVVGTPWVDIATALPNMTIDQVHLAVSASQDGYDVAWRLTCITSDCPGDPFASGRDSIPFQVDAAGFNVSGAFLRLVVEDRDSVAEKPQALDSADLKVAGRVHMRWGPPMVDRVHEYPFSFQTSPCIDAQLGCSTLGSQHARIQLAGFAHHVALEAHWQAQTPPEQELRFWVHCEPTFCPSHLETAAVPSPAQEDDDVEMNGEIWVSAGVDYANLLGNFAGSGTTVEGVLSVSEWMMA